MQATSIDSITIAQEEPKKELSSHLLQFKAFLDKKGGIIDSPFPRASNKRILPRTKKIYLYEAKKYLEHLNGQLVNENTAQDYLKYLETGDANKNPSSPTSIRMIAIALKSFFYSRGTETNFRVPEKLRPKVEYLRDGEVRRILECAETSLEKALIQVLYDTACRINEILNLELYDIDWEYGNIIVTRKGENQSQVNIGPKALEALKDYVDQRTTQSQQVFGGISYNRAWKTIKDLGIRAFGKEAEKRVHPHSFRHSRAISMLNKGAGMEVVQQHLGHKDIRTTINIYGQFQATHLKERIPAVPY